MRESGSSPGLSPKRKKRSIGAPVKPLRTNVPAAMPALEEALLGQNVHRSPQRAERHPVLGSQHRFGRYRRPGCPFARYQAQAQRVGQSAVAVLTGRRM